MVELKPEQVAAYFHRGYTAVDGLWFMKIEERYGFDVALEIDVAVWGVMPKIQARKLKELIGLDHGVDALRECFTTKLSLEKFDYVVKNDPDGRGFEVQVTQCPWYDFLKKSGRQHLAERIGNRICNTEYAVWATEFGNGISVRLGDQLCAGCDVCRIRFELR